MQPIRKLLLREILALVALLVVVWVGLAWEGLGRMLDRQMAERSQESLGRLSRDVGEDLARIERVGHTVGQWWKDGRIRADRIEAAEAQIAPILEALPEVANLVFVTPEGWGLSCSQEASGLATYHLDARQDAALKRYLRKEGRPLAGSPWEPTPYRVFSRPWYPLAQAAQGPRWIPAYRFVNRPTHGLSYVVPLRDGEGRFRGALCVDIFLSALTQRAWAAHPTPHSQVLVSDVEGQALILPRGSAPSLDPRAPAPFLQKVSPAFLPLFDRLLGTWRKEGQPSRAFRVRHEGTTYIAQVVPLDGVEGVRWFLSLAVPDRDYLGSQRRLALGLLGVGLLAVGLAAWRAQRLAQRFSQPLEALAQATVHLGTGATPPRVPTEIAEIQTLARTLESAGEALAKEAELQLQLQRSQRLETLGTLAGGIAHDVNNHLAAIVGQLNLGREYLPPEHPTVARLEKSEEAAQRCAQMVQGLLGFAKQGHSDMRPLDLNAVVRRTASLLERLLGGIIRLELELEPSLPTVEGNEVSLEQVLMNLSINARDAMPQGGRLRISTFQAADGRVGLTVQDTGTGIPPELLGRIFDPFFTTKEVGKGSGLGLAMVFGLIRDHGGSIEVDSQVGRGTEFRIHLPALPGGGSKGEVPAAAQAPSPSSCLAGRRVLVVDDEAHLRELLAEAFTRHRAQVDTAPDGAQAWALFQGGRYDLVVSDQRMPEVTGLELLARIRSVDPTAPVILASGYGLQEAQGVTERDPHVRLMGKPFSLQRLFALAAELLDPPQGPTPHGTP